VWKFAPPAASGEGSISGLEFDFKGGGVKSTVRMQWTEIPLQPQGQLPGMRSNAPAAQYTLRTDPINPPANIKTIFIVPAPREATGFLYQHLLNATREKNIPGIVNLASIVDKRITNLVPLVESGQGQVYADIGLDRLMPITVMGAGFSNMLQIAVAIVETKSQVIIIDEIEDGLHYTTYPQIAQALIRFATTVDVQFFLSTHSAEFLDAFVAVARSLDFSDVCSLRIADRSGRKVVTRFDASDLNNAKEIELDVR
jgi:hypothetical protein